MFKRKIRTRLDLLSYSRLSLVCRKTGGAAYGPCTVALSTKVKSSAVSVGERPPDEQADAGRDG